MRLIYSFLVVFISTSGLSQNTDNDLDEIKNRVNDYFIGWEQKNVSLLNNIFHSEATLKYLDRNKEYAVVDIQQHIEDITNAEAKFLPAHVRSVNAVNIFKEGASVIVHLRFKSFEVTDFFQLMKINGQWKIINKMSVSSSLPDELKN